VVIILMGVAGSGKTAVGRALADALGWRFEDADAYHSAPSIAKMRRGMPLSDADRAPWLAALHGLVERATDRREPLVLACSALKEEYRQTLAGRLHGVRFVHLTADEATLRRRLESRANHFFGPSLLASQLAALEPPRDALTLDTTPPIEQIVAKIRYELGL
jgi:carbohydrate kinase (thermoresistant glucokinase family)